MRYPPGKELSFEEKNLIWRFRFYLTKDKKALSKFLNSVIWTDQNEVKQAVELLYRWVDVDVEDALELLSAGFPFKEVRKFAVEKIRKAEDDVKKIASNLKGIQHSKH